MQRSSVHKRVFCAVEDSVASEWGELDRVAEDVKENWDDSEGEGEGEGELKGEEREEVQEPVSASPTRDSVPALPDVAVQEASVADESDADVTDDSESSSESEDDSLSGPERQRARVCRRLQVGGGTMSAGGGTVSACSVH